MLYARVVLGLPVEGPFDYTVPGDLAKRIKVGSRVRISFGPRKLVGYVVALSKKTSIKKLKAILGLIDEEPVLDKGMLGLTKELSDYYCCSWGEMIETALPDGLRKGRMPLKSRAPDVSKSGREEALLIHDSDGRERWDVYLSEIKKALDGNKSALVILPDIGSAEGAKEIIDARLGTQSELLYRNQPKESEAWLNINEARAKIIVGTRSCIFAPAKDLGLVIIEEEENSVYKQDQVPHYHVREVALMRIKQEGAKLILGSASPSLESYYLSIKKKINYLSIPRKKEYPEIKIIDLKFMPPKERKRNPVFARPLEEAIFSVLGQKGKTLLFLNRRGFATFASCHNCATVLKCERCNVNLVYHFEEDLLKCHYCNFKMKLPKICPKCNSGYIKFSGTGTEKIESELHRIFPQARIKRLEKEPKPNINEADIFVATSGIFKQADLAFDLVCALAIDNSLNRVDLRASEKTASLLSGLLGLTDKKIMIQTHFPGHHVFEALLKKDINLFYEKELETRKQLNFPPYKHMALVKLRGRKAEKVKEASQLLFEKLKQHNKGRDIKILSVNPGQPSKLRGNFYWQILISSGSARKISKFLKLRLKDFRHSGIIVTVDVDPL